MKKNYFKQSITITVVCIVLFSGKVFSQFANWHLNTGDSSIFYNAGNVGIGVVNPLTTLDVNGNMILRGGNISLSNINFGINGDGVLGFNVFNGALGDFNSGLKNIMNITTNGWFGIGGTDQSFAPFFVGAQTTSYPYVQPLATFVELDSEQNFLAEMDFITKNSENAYNEIVKENDFSIIWTDYHGGFSDYEVLNSTSGFVIAPQQPEGYTAGSKPSGIRIDASGNVGIGVKDPKSSLDIIGDLSLYQKDVYLDTNFNSGIGFYGPTLHQNTWYPYDLVTSTKLFSGKDIGGGTVVYGFNGGALGIRNGKDENIALRWMPDSANNTLILIDGKVRAREVDIRVNVWADYVFGKNYNLMSLGQLEQYIKVNNHLPDVPTEKEAIDKGVNVGDMQTILLKKVEEISLYLIELKKENDNLKKENDVLKNRVDAIENTKK